MTTNHLSGPGSPFGRVECNETNLSAVIDRSRWTVQS